MSKSLILRPYQELALAQIRRHYATGTKRVLLHMATGGGKTVIFSTVMKGVHQKGNKSILAVRGRELVDNASQRLMREGVEHGVMMANHHNWQPDLPIQVCSIDTLVARKKKLSLPQADLTVIDEAHFAVSHGFRWFIDEYQKRGCYMLSVTATPHVRDGLKHLADVVVYPITIRDLIEQGYLVPPRYFAPPNKINLDKVRIDSRTGDYNTGDLSREVEKAHVTGDVIAHYRALANGRPAVLFACDVAHSKRMVESLNLAGISSVHIDADSSDVERKDALAKLESGDIKIVSNVGILCTGVDMPYVSAIILARPTKSYNLFIQQVGRGTRPFRDKTNFIVLDHAGNVNEHGFIETERECILTGRKEREERPQLVTCKRCYHVFDSREQWEQNNRDLFSLGKRGRDYTCKGLIFTNMQQEICAFDNSPIRRENVNEIITNVDGKLVPILNSGEIQITKQQRFIESLIKKAVDRGYKPAWIFYQLKARYGEKLARQKYIEIKARIFS